MAIPNRFETKSLNGDFNIRDAIAPAPIAECERVWETHGRGKVLFPGGPQTARCGGRPP